MRNSSRRFRLVKATKLCFTGLGGAKPIGTEANHWAQKPMGQVFPLATRDR
jgi:hypothetical protein